LSPAARRLLSTLQGGDGRDIAEPNTYPGGNAFSSHARAYFINASSLCEHQNGHDFAVFGVLYGLRHGLELWLKWLIQMEVLAAVMGDFRRKPVLETVIAAAQRLCDEDAQRERLLRKQIVVDAQCERQIIHNAKRDCQQLKKQLIHALCVMRNVEAGITYPRCQAENIGESFARDQLAKGILDQYSLQVSWPVPIYGHDLCALWQEAEMLADIGYHDARMRAMYAGTGEPLSPQEIGAACDLLGTWDKDGDSFRYPCSLGGTWYLHLPPLNLRALGKLADALDATVLAYKPE
jgi:hypothetical protein